MKFRWSWGQEFDKICGYGLGFIHLSTKDMKLKW
jgi:hypothetical protein